MGSSFYCIVTAVAGRLGKKHLVYSNNWLGVKERYPSSDDDDGREKKKLINGSHQGRQKMEHTAYGEQSGLMQVPSNYRR